MPEQTIVIFRKFKNGEVIAIFPFEIGASHPGTCSSYMHIGQHGTWEGPTTGTKPATEAEYMPLKKELENIGYSLKVGQRIPRNAYQIRKEKLQAIYTPADENGGAVTVADAFEVLESLSKN